MLDPRDAHLNQDKGLKEGDPKGPTPEGKKEVSEAIFKALDKNEDGYLNSEELSKGREVGPKVAKDLKFQKLDLNSNNKVSKEEFISPVKKRFSALERIQTKFWIEESLWTPLERKKTTSVSIKTNVEGKASHYA
ncbi:MAG: hypothetical protein Ct9H300mP20_19360 [Gammaproteobacteria bacterium]|nr:MAG: hypothetical protein Ct9H300mP20_19360 [Gammaproteobacteria bacterium]